jgi:hypothetical protein
MIKNHFNRPTIPSVSHSVIGGQCAVCGGAKSEAGTELVNAILLHAQVNGSFSVTSVEQFWRTFDSHLCKSCRSKLERRQSGYSFAKHLLQEALKLDPTNVHAQENMKALT